MHSFQNLSALVHGVEDMVTTIIKPKLSEKRMDIGGFLISSIAFYAMHECAIPTANYHSI